MNEQSHRNFQNLPKIGPVYTTKDEKQRQVAEEIMNFRIRPEMKLKINMNIPGLDKKKQITALNPETRRVFGRLSSKGREGWTYIWLYSNSTRFFLPFLMFAWYYYAGHTLITAKHSESENNYEWEAAYCKMQTLRTHYMDRWSLMA